MSRAVLALAALLALGMLADAAHGQAVGEGAELYAVALNLPLAADPTAPAHQLGVRRMQDDLLAEFAPHELEVVRRFALVPGLAVRVSSPDVLRRLRQSVWVAAVGLDVGGGADLNLSAPFVGATAAHAAGWRGQGRTVAVIDSGVDTDHPDLASDLIDGACFCVSGVSCCGASGSTGLGLVSAEDDAGHGTHVTGIITSDGVVAPLGIAPQAKVVAVRVMNNQNLAATSDIIAALEWVRINHPNVDAVNLSLGTSTLFPANCDVPGPGYSPPAFMINLKLAFDVMAQAGILAVASAGNDGDHTRSGAPGCLSNVFTVGATAHTANSISGFSNSTEAVDLWAPGDQIQSSFIFGMSANLSGTSMAAPHVTASVALIRQSNANHTLSTLQACLRTSPVSITDPVNGITRPRLDVPSAIAACGAFNNGQACALGAECSSGICEDSVCCNVACGGSNADCLACSVAAGAQVDGQCGTAQAGAVCRGAAGQCDPEEVCDGLSAACPADALAGAGVSCRPSVGPCDLAEVCSGADPECPPDAKFGGVCRAAAGACDQPEACDGVRDSCPPDLLWGASIECRAAAGPCDAPEFCDGVRLQCPPDRMSTAVCRPAVGVCDQQERCDGTQVSCPPDAWAPAGRVCRGEAGPCDRPEVCDGLQGSCPADLKRTSVCRAAMGACDLAELCDGQGDRCPEDVYRGLGHECRAAQGDCDLAEVCTGADAECPQDSLRTGVCRPAAGACDAAEWCDGVRVQCGEDRVRSSTVACRPAAHACDQGELCDGRAAACPEDVPQVDGAPCGDAQVCNGLETCRAGVCSPGAPLACDDADPCTVGRCEEPGGCVQEPAPNCCTADQDCADGDACTRNDCVQGQCISTPELSCGQPEPGCSCRDTAASSSGLLWWLMLGVCALRAGRRYYGPWSSSRR